LLVSQRLVTVADRDEVRECLDLHWSELLAECGLHAVPTATRVKARQHLQMVRPAGILLTGGNDLSCCAPHDELSAARDAFELELVEAGLEAGVPILGVCRGMQLLAHAYGSEPVAGPGHVGCEHTIDVASGSLLSRFFPPSCEVNSYHDYCLVELGDDLETVARSRQDQTVEALAHRALPIHGIMWHPERSHPFRAEDVAFIREVFLGSPTGGDG
jgi:putative glutamine amidotransferase